MTIFTGPIDEFFGYALGRLQYRGQQRVTTYDPAATYLQPAGQVNEPQHAAGPHIRSIEWKHLMRPRDVAQVRGTVMTRETPFSPTEPDHFEYPFPDDRNRILYQQYRALAAGLPDTLICGRLGEYRYYDMDQAIARALVLAKRILERARNTSGRQRSDNIAYFRPAPRLSKCISALNTNG